MAYLHMASCLFCFVLIAGLMGSSASSTASPDSSGYLIGTGSYDITGPAADVNMMGYANPLQNAAGIHIRLRARTFIVAEKSSTNESIQNRIVFVNLDACMASQAVTNKVLQRLKNRYGDMYSEKNVAISGTHTHSGPGGYLQYVLYIITSMGFVRRSFDAIVDGIENSIIQAHDNLRPGSIFVNHGDLLDANINRSPSAYLNNPSKERALYQYNVDKQMTLLKFVDSEWGPVGAFNWFAVHGTSMSRDNKLISGDNKGVAARLMEDWYDNQLAEKGEWFIDSFDTADILSSVISKSDKRASSRFVRFSSASDGKRPEVIPRRVRSLFQGTSRPRFVAAFCQSNVGDTSPNVQGAVCLDTGIACDFNHSTCSGRSELCIGRGPAYPDDFASTTIIGDRQFKKAVQLFDGATKQLSGTIGYRQKHLDFSKLEVDLPSGEKVHTCPAAVGFSFAAGTTDGPGAFDFKQGDHQGNTFWRIVGAALKPPAKSQIKCQQPKPVLIDTGEMTKPYSWAPSILPIQILRVGQMVLLSVPAEFTTMAGRRLRDAVKETLIAESGGEFNKDTVVVIAGLTNAYSQYVTTYEEYEIQRYEGASTLYGPHTLSAYIQEFQKLAAALAKGEDVEEGPSPPLLLDKQLELLPPVVLDSTPSGSSFGDLIEDVPSNSSYTEGDIVKVKFWSACPRNDLFTESTFALVERLDNDENWVPAYDDDDLCLRFMWGRPFLKSPQSFATIRWEIPDRVVPGVYRIRHFGAAKHFFGSVRHFIGTTKSFVVY
ncbi:hypothetical protein GOP47_0018850 [Adiantum capillus-veneris]|uniref:Neutral ceramidase n=1 Tax=Adiantum capillus-veneris TaxID=13818 RepID=A0A9D4UFE0_ADICA|nr:hypothetical protein GOP47_0018850 [Adiantum capillus-veneris]